MLYIGSELWEDDFNSLLGIVKEFTIDVWESRKLRLYGENACPGPQLNSSGWINDTSPILSHHTITCILTQS